MKMTDEVRLYEVPFIPGKTEIPSLPARFKQKIPPFLGGIYYLSLE
jgi:hypothetical protein